MQKLDFNKDGKLVAYTDNGCTDGKSATTEVKGTFEVSADVVKFILAKEYELPAILSVGLEKEGDFGYNVFKHFYCYIGNDKQQAVLESLKRRLNKQKKVLEDYRQRVDELKRLRKAVDDFNKNARFYERKIKI